MTPQELKQLADLSDEVIKLKAKIIKIRSELLASSLFEENEADEIQPSFLAAAQTDANTVLVAGALRDFLEENLRKSNDEKWTNEIFGAGWIAALMHVKVNFLDKQNVQHLPLTQKYTQVYCG